MDGSLYWAVSPLTGFDQKIYTLLDMIEALCWL
jgi:hypothetical protein